MPLSHGEVHVAIIQTKHERPELFRIKTQSLDGHTELLFRIGPKRSHSSISSERGDQDAIHGIDIYLAHVGITSDEVARFTVGAFDGITKHALRIFKFSISRWRCLDIACSQGPTRLAILEAREARNEPSIRTHRHVALGSSMRKELKPAQVVTRHAHLIHIGHRQMVGASANN